MAAARTAAKIDAGALSIPGAPISKDARVVVVGSQDFFDYFEQQNGRKRIRVTAKQGDTLKKVGQRYGMASMAGADDPGSVP